SAGGHRASAAAAAPSREGHRQPRSGREVLHLASAPLPVGRLHQLEVVHASDVFDGPVAAAAMTGETSASRCFFEPEIDHFVMAITSRAQPPRYAELSTRGRTPHGQIGPCC